MSHSYETGKAISDLGSKQPHELLLMLGGLLAVLLTVATYGIQSVNPGIPQNQYGTDRKSVMLGNGVGLGVWRFSAIKRKNLMNGAIVAGGNSINRVYFR